MLEIDGGIMNTYEIAMKINNCGGRLFLVGGAVRDKLLGKVPKDYDFCVVGLDANTFSKLFPEATLRGKEFPVFEIDDCEYALARCEKKIKEGHNGFEITSNKDVTLEQDLKRRDITINSIAIDVITGEVIDYFNGRNDLKNGIIRAISPAFLEDPLRIYRAARFAACFKYSVHKETIALMKQGKFELASLSVERVFSEFSYALGSDKPSIFFNILREASCLDVHFKEIADLINVPQPIKYHPEGDAYVHTMEVLDKASMMTSDLKVRFGALVHDFGKANTQKEMLPRHIGHEERGVPNVENFCKRLKMPTAFLYAGKTACIEHMRAGIFNEMRISTKVDFLTRLAKTRLGLKGIEIIANADRGKKHDKVFFADVGNKMIKEVNAKNYPKDLDYKIINERLRQERIKWLERNYLN